MSTLRHQTGLDFALAIARRFLRIRLRTAALLSLPAVLLCAWNVWRVESSLSGYRAVWGEQVPPSLEDFQLVMHDVLQRDLRILLMDRAAPPKQIRRFDLDFSRRNRAVLIESAGSEGKRPYVQAMMRTGDQTQPVSVQVRGSQPWQVLGASRTMRVRLPAGELYDGHRVFNLINDPSPFVVGEEIVLEMSRSLGVLTPHTSFARVSMNGKDLGVFHYETQPDESLLRMWGRIPGSMYAGDLKRGMPTESLWTDPSTWKKHAWRVAEEKKTCPDLERLLAQVSGSTIAEFTDFARHEMDLEAFARFEALDIAFGSEQRDFRHNHRLYFDPYKGRWEPVAWRFSAFKHEPFFDLVENPLMLRLKQVPEYPTLLAATLYAFLTEEGSLDAVRGRSMRALEELAPELRSDRDWYAERLLPRFDDVHRKLLRPMTLDRAALILASEMETYAARHVYLMRELTRNPLKVALRPPTRTESVEPSSQRVGLRLLGRSGVRLERLGVTAAAGCQNLRWTVRLDGRAIVPETSSEESLLPIPIELQPAFGITARADVDEENGGVRFAPVSATHELSLESTCGVTAISVDGTQLSTGTTIHARAVAALGEWPRTPSLEAATVPSFQPGELPYVPKPRWVVEPRVLQLGPGVVEVSKTRVFSADELVEVAKGTQFRLGRNASLIFLGRVRMMGTHAEPVVIEPQGREAWGGIALQGKDTAGSELTHVSIRGGTAASWRMVSYPATVSIHDTRDITLRGCVLESNGAELDMLHAAYVKDLRVFDTTVRKAAADGLDLEFTTAKLRGVEVTTVGDDALDFMGSTVQLQATMLMDGRGNGLSAGEGSHVRATHLFVGGFDVGVLAKNASEVRLAETLLYRNRSGARIYRKESRFAGDSEVHADEVFVVECEKAVRVDHESRSAARLTRIRTTLPTDGSLDFLRNGVLGIDAWQLLPGWMAHRDGGS